MIIICFALMGAARIAAEQTTAPGKKAALEYIAAHPEATQQEVAEAAGIHLGST
jgi:hypothetical protein